MPPPKPEALQLLTPTPTEQAAYYQRFLQTWKALRGPGFPLDEARDLERAAQTFVRGLNPAGVARQLAAILASGSRGEALRAVRVPTLVIHGDADPLVPVECDRIRPARARSEAADRRGHGPCAADPEAAGDHRRDCRARALSAMAQVGLASGSTP